MPGVDLATLGLRVDFKPVTSAHGELDKLTAAGERAEAQAGQLASAAERGYRRAAGAARESAQAQVEALEREYTLAEAAIKEALVRGFITPKEAAKQGRLAAQAYNTSLIQTIDRASASGGLNRNTRAGSAAFVGLIGNLKDVDQAGRRAGLGLGRLNDAFVTVARQATGTSPVVGKLVDTIGTFAIGTAYMVPVLAGLAAIGFAWQKITEDARKAKEAQEKAIKSALEAARIRSLGAAGGAAEELANSVAAESEIQGRLVELRQQLSRAQRSGNENRVNATAERIRATTAELRRAETATQELRTQVFENTKREQERLDALAETGNRDAKKAADDAIRIAERKARGLERLATETERRRGVSAGVVGGLAQQVSDAQRLAAANLKGADAVEQVNRQLAREQALRVALASAVPADVRAIESQVNALYDLRDAAADAATVRARTSKEFTESLEGIEKAQAALREEEERAAAEAQAWRDAWVNAAVDVASAFGLSAGNAAAFAANAHDSIRLASQSPTQGAASAISSIGGFAGAAVSTILESRRERAAAVKAAAEEFDRVLDDYVATLADRGRFDQLKADAEAGAKGALDALLNSLLADLSTRGDFGAEAAQKIKDAIAQGLDQQGLEGILGQFGSEGQQVLDTYLEHLKRIEEQRQKEIAGARDSLRVRELIAQGRTEEAAALERRLEYEAQIKAALELGDKALADYTRSVQEQEEAARAAAKAEQERADALARQRQTVQDRLNVEGREAALRGDDRGAFKASLVGGALSEQAALDDRLAKGEIEVDLYRRLSEVIDSEVLKALRDFDDAVQATADAARQAAAAEAFRQGQDRLALQAELALLQGRDDAALQYQQQIRLQQALNDERDDEYLALLAQIQAQQLANKEAEKAAEAARESARAQDELTRALDGGLSVIGGPGGLTSQLRNYRNEALRTGGGPADFGVSSPSFTPQQQTNNSFEIVIQTQPGQDNVIIGQQVYQQVVAEVERQKRLGGFNRLGDF